jgi:hypothetical protein
MAPIIVQEKTSKNERLADEGALADTPSAVVVLKQLV